MKKFILLTSLFILTVTGFASHLMGGQITAQKLSGLTYQIDLTLYRDMFGTTMPSQTSINIENTITGNSFASSANSSGPFSLLNGVEEYTYSYLVTFPATGNYLISWSSCCRNAAIQNIYAPGTQSFFIFNLLTIDTISDNSSPVFLNPPVVLAQLNDTFYYNPLPFDIDGDSLTWKIDTPLGTGYNDFLQYTVPSANSGGPFTMNPLTGEITWIPDMQGHFVASFIIEEFRNGVKIGEIRRDMQYIVIDVPGNTSGASISTAGWPVDPAGNYLFDVDINTPFTLSIIATDSDNDDLTAEANGEAFMIANAATFNNISSAPGSLVNEFYWAPTVNEQRIAPYITVFRIFETHAGTYTFARDLTVLLSVGDFTSINENTNAVVNNIYPNPSTGELFISVNVEKSSDVKITFVNQFGQEVKRFDRKLNAGQNLVYLHDLGLSNGVYYVNMNIEGLTYNQKFIIKK